jgi:uncharacterized membrane protein YbhN (UPF0104 family)
MANRYITKLQNFSHKLTDSMPIRLFKRYKKALAIIVILAVIIFFGVYIYLHPKVIDNVIKIGLINTIIILVLYAGVLLTNVVVTQSTIRICNKKLSIKNNLLLTIYSSVINFFGPLQSGPAVRAIYLKTKVGLRIRDYTYAMLFYYAIFAAVNISLLFIGKWWWLSLIGILATVGLIIAGTIRFGLTQHRRQIGYISLATLIQIILMVAIYSIELTAIAPTAHYSLLQTTTYTAGANLALFVSLTPGAIGFREAFLILSQSLHHIPLSSIVTAGIIDRAIYVVFLGLLFILSSAMHLKNMFVRK